MGGRARRARRSSCRSGSHSLASLHLPRWGRHSAYRCRRLTLRRCLTYAGPLPARHTARCRRRCRWRGCGPYGTRPRPPRGTSRGSSSSSSTRRRSVSSTRAPATWAACQTRRPPATAPPRRLRPPCHRARLSLSLRLRLRLRLRLSPSPSLRLRLRLRLRLHDLDQAPEEIMMRCNQVRSK